MSTDGVGSCICPGVVAEDNDWLLDERRFIGFRLSARDDEDFEGGGPMLMLLRL